jgi:hypothetical protein
LERLFLLSIPPGLRRITDSSRKHIIDIFNFTIMAGKTLAVERVFATFELVENIIKDFSAAQLLQLQRLTRFVQDEIWSSPLTRETLFLDALPFSARKRQGGAPTTAFKNPIRGLPITPIRVRDLRIWVSNNDTSPHCPSQRPRSL